MTKQHLMACGITAIVCTLWLTGCDKRDRLETVQVTGTVSLDGRPLSIGTVVFTPEKGRSATGAVQSDGTYCLGTYTASDGAVPGLHHVSVVARENAGAENARRGPIDKRPGKWLIPEFYADYTQSGLVFEVKQDGSNVYDIPISSTAQPKGQ